MWWTTCGRYIASTGGIQSSTLRGKLSSVGESLRLERRVLTYYSYSRSALVLSLGLVMLFRDAAGLFSVSTWPKIEDFEASMANPAESSSARDSPIGPVFCRLILGVSRFHEDWGKDGTRNGSEMAGEDMFGRLGVLCMSW